MLADQRLRHRQRVDEFVHTARRLVKLQHDRDPHGRGQRTQQIARGVEDARGGSSGSGAPLWS